MRQPAGFSENPRQFVKSQVGDCVRNGAVRRHAVFRQRGLANQMRRLAARPAKSQIDARLPVINRRRLRVQIGGVQNATVRRTARKSYKAGRPGPR